MYLYRYKAWSWQKGFSISAIPRRVRKTTAHSCTLIFRRIAQLEPRLHVDPWPSITPLLEDFHDLQWNIQATSQFWSARRQIRNIGALEQYHRWKDILLFSQTNGLLMISEQIRLTWIYLFMINAAIVESQQDSETKIFKINTPTSPSDLDDLYRFPGNVEKTPWTPRFLRFPPWLPLLLAGWGESPRRGSRVHRQVPRPGRGTGCENPKWHTWLQLLNSSHSTPNCPLSSTFFLNS